VLARRGTDAWVFRGDDGLDELTTTGTSTVWVVRHGTATETTFEPADLGIPRTDPDSLRGADAAFNASVARKVFGGEAGPVQDMVRLNAAAALVAAAGAPPASELTEALRAAYQRAAEAVDSGAAAALLDRWISVSQRLRAN
jgi:anthranilate phosphoribosyltransferase